MPVQAIRPDYRGEDKDRVELFHGKQLLYIGWDRHTMVCSPIALPVPPELAFRTLVEQVLPTTAYAADPDWSRIDWSQVQWLRAGQPFTPDMAKSLAENGLGHKALLRLRTPGLAGI